MARNWMKMVDSAQRRITLDDPESPSFEELERLTFDIQGLVAEYGGRDYLFQYTDMADLGIRLKGARPLTVWQRLRRRPAMAGEVVLEQDTVILVSFWTQPVIDLRFNLAFEEDAALWRECEIMVLSAGFHFRMDPNLGELDLRTDFLVD